MIELCKATLNLKLKIQSWEKVQWVSFKTDILIEMYSFIRQKAFKYQIPTSPFYGSLFLGLSEKLKLCILKFRVINSKL